MWRVFFFLLFPAICLAQPSVSQDEMRITSDSLSYSQDKKTVVFSGNVHVLKQDFEIWARKMTVFLQPGQTGEKAAGTGLGATRGTIKKIVADGQVRLQSGTRVATAESVTYSTVDETIRLTGNPLLQEGKNELRGEVVILNLKDNTSEILGGEKPVEALFFTNEKDGENPF